MKFEGFTRTQITQEEYRNAWKLSLLVVASVSDPTGWLSPMSTPGEYRMVTVWGTECDTPALEANTRGEETSYFKYETKQE